MGGAGVPILGGTGFAHVRAIVKEGKGKGKGKELFALLGQPFARFEV